MNERIRELAKLAGLHKEWFIDNPEIEKFAELIVRDCAKFLDENSGYDNANNAFHPEPEDLLKHFGIK